MDQLKSQTKPFEISKWEVKEAWEDVRENKGAPGVDGQSIDDFERDLKNNLYRVWNRMSSGSYFPPPVRMVASLALSRFQPHPFTHRLLLRRVPARLRIPHPHGIP
ncbi:hypothetical protein [Streptomyces sp. NPDC057910]|uniref:hypothetical protein n=1 Tax=Streptomyces sp. NPDC057910 TaxID=3346278 RepID=UPI0036E51597